MSNRPEKNGDAVGRDISDSRAVLWYFTCDLPFCLVLNGDVSASMGVGVAHFDFTVVRQESKDPRIGDGRYDLEPDRYGLASYSHLRCELAWNAYLALARSLGIRHTDEVGIATFLVNRAVQAYRHATNAYWVKPLSEHGMFRLETGTVSQSGVVTSRIRDAFAGMKVQLPKKALNPETHRAFIEGLSAAGEPPIWKALLLDAEDSAERGQFRIAVVEAHSAIETLSSAIVLAYLRETYDSVGDAIDAEVDDKDLAKKIRGSEPASLEDLVADTPDSAIVGMALKKAGVAAVYEEGPILRWFAEIACLRNAAVHQGAEVRADEAQALVLGARTVASVLLKSFGADRLASSKAASVANLLDSYLSVPIHPFLRDVLGALESSGRETVLIRSRLVKPPLGSCLFETCRVREGGRRVEVLVPPPRVQRNQSIDVEAELASRFIENRLISGENWPFADVMSCAPVDHEAYAAAASLLTEVSLTQEVLARSRAASYDLSPGLTRFLESQLACASKRLVGQQPAVRSYDYFVLPLLLMRLHFHKPEASCDDLLKQVEGMTNVADVFGRLAQVSSLLDLRCQSDAATWILASKVILLGGDYDTIGVREGPDRRLRTRLKPEEVVRLGWRHR